MTARPKTPAGLGPAGSRVWRAVVDVYSLRPDEVLVLEKVARTADDLGRIEAAMNDEPLMTVGSQGQPRAHPLLVEIRGLRALLVTLLRQLGLPDAVNETRAAERATSRSSNARAAARARWDRGTGRGA